MISKKKQKGVTLISLVITIIILIILASISVKVLLGEDGLITKAKEAKKAQKISEIKERISLEITSAKAEAILRNEELEKAQVKDIIEPKYGTLKEDGDTIVTKEGNYEISLQEIYYSALSESGSYSAKVEQVEMLEQQVAQLTEELQTANNKPTGFDIRVTKWANSEASAGFTGEVQVSTASSGSFSMNHGYHSVPSHVKWSMSGETLVFKMDYGGYGTVMSTLYVTPKK